MLVMPRITVADLYHNEIQSSAFAEITKAHRKAGTKNRKVGRGDIITGLFHKSQLEARKAFTPKTNDKSVPETYQARTKKAKRKRSSTNSCTEPQGTKTVKQLGNARACVFACMFICFVMYLICAYVYVLRVCLFILDNMITYAHITDGACSYYQRLRAIGEHFLVSLISSPVYYRM